MEEGDQQSSVKLAIDRSLTVAVGIVVVNVVVVDNVVAISAFIGGETGGVGRQGWSQLPGAAHHKVMSFVSTLTGTPTGGIDRAERGM